MSARSRTNISSLEMEDDDDTHIDDDVDKRKNNLRRVYMSDVRGNFHEQQLTSLKKALRTFILPHVKFVKDNTRAFGSFDKPDFTDKHCWQNALFKKMPGLYASSDARKAKMWMTYRSKLKMEFSNVRAHVTKRIKANFINGKYM